MIDQSFLNRKYVWNEHNVCLNPLVFDFGHDKKCECLISLAEDDIYVFRGYEYGYNTDTTDHGHSSALPSKGEHSRPYPSPLSAVAAGLREAIEFFKTKPAAKFVASLKAQLANIEQSMQLPPPTRESIMQQAKPLIDAETGNQLPQEESSGTQSTTPTMAAAARPAAISPKDKESAERISASYRRAINGLRDVVLCGVDMLEEKAKLKHGNFGKWLETNCPEIPRSTATRFMQQGEIVMCSVLGVGSFNQIAHSEQFGNMHISSVLQLPFSQIPPDYAKIQQDFLSFIDGKTQKEIIIGWRDKEPPKGKHNPIVHTPEEIEQIANDAANQEVEILASQLTELDNQVLARATAKNLKGLKNACKLVLKRIPNPKAKAKV